MRDPSVIIAEVCASLPNIQSMSPNQVYEECVKSAQIEAYNQAIDDAVKNAKLHKKYYNIYDHRTMYERWKDRGYPRMDGYGIQSGVDVVSINKNSILKLKKQ